MVKFTQATCPSCGGQLQIPDNLTKAFCSYCGATVLVEWEGRPGPGPTVASYMKLGKGAMQGLNYTGAYEYFAKALELNPDHREAWLWKGAAAGGCYETDSAYFNPQLTQDRFDEALQCIRQSGFTHDEMVALLVDGLKTDSPESNRAIAGYSGSYGVTGLLGIAYWAPLDFAMLFLDAVAQIEPSAITSKDYSRCIAKAGLAKRDNLVRSLAESALASASAEERPGIAQTVISQAHAYYWRSRSAEAFNEAAALLELAFRICPAKANEIAGRCTTKGMQYEIHGENYEIHGGYLEMADQAAEAGLLDLAEQYLERSLEITRDKKWVKKGVNFVKRKHGLRRPKTGWF